MQVKYVRHGHEEISQVVILETLATLSDDWQLFHVEPTCSSYTGPQFIPVSKRSTKSIIFDSHFSAASSPPLRHVRFEVGGSLYLTKIDKIIHFKVVKVTEPMEDVNCIVKPSVMYVCEEAKHDPARLFQLTRSFFDTDDDIFDCLEEAKAFQSKLLALVDHNRVLYPEPKLLEKPHATGTHLFYKSYDGIQPIKILAFEVSGNLSYYICENLETTCNMCIFSDEALFKTVQEAHAHKLHVHSRFMVDDIIFLNEYGDQTCNRIVAVDYFPKHSPYIECRPLDDVFVNTKNLRGPFYGTFKIHASHGTAFRSAASAKKEIIRNEILQAMEEKEALFPEEAGGTEDKSLLCNEDLVPEMFQPNEHEAKKLSSEGEDDKLSSEGDDEEVVLIDSPLHKKVAYFLLVHEITITCVCCRHDAKAADGQLHDLSGLLGIYYVINDHGCNACLLPNSIYKYYMACIWATAKSSQTCHLYSVT